MEACESGIKEACPGTSMGTILLWGAVAVGAYLVYTKTSVGTKIKGMLKA
jgi:hypothetical protein